MKATQEQYDECVVLYEQGGATAVYMYADDKGIDDWSLCSPCDIETPDTDDGCCLVCGSLKSFEYEYHN